MGIRFVVMEMVAKIPMIELEKVMIRSGGPLELIRLTCMQYAESVCTCNKDSIADFGS